MEHNGQPVSLSAIISGSAQLGFAVVAAVEDRLIEMVSVERVQHVLGYLDAGDPFGREPSDRERKALDLISALRATELEDFILTRVRWVSELAVLYSIGTDHGGLTPESGGLAKLRHKVEAAGR
jgi:hypothetical protein